MSRFGEGLAVDTDVERAARRATYGALSTVEGAPDLVTVFAGVTDPDDADRVAATVHAMVAATARVHRLHIATRNIRDFKDFDVDVFNPYAAR